MLQVLGLVIAMSALIAWVAMGANRGWTKTSVEVKTVDEVTGIEGIHYRKVFLPGVEFLGGALFAAGVLVGASIFVRKPKK